MRIKYIMQVYNDSNLKLSAFMMQKNTYMCVLRTAKSFCQRRFFLNVLLYMFLLHLHAWASRRRVVIKSNV